MTDQLTGRERQLLDAWTPIEPPAGFSDRVLGARAAARRRPWLAGGLAAAVAAAAAIVVATRPDAPVRHPTIVDPAPAVAVAGPSAEVIVRLYETVVVHDPDGAATIRFEDPGLCHHGMWVEITHNNVAEAPRITEGRIELSAGGWAYRAHCHEDEIKEAIPTVASGEVIVLPDDASRALPSEPAQVPIPLDGGEHRVTFASQPPDLVFHAPTDPPYRLHVMPPDLGQQVLEDRVIESPTRDVIVPGNTVDEGTYGFRFDTADQAMFPTRVTLAVDPSAPQIQLESKRLFDGSVLVRGHVQAGWGLRAGPGQITLDGRCISRRACEIAVRVEHPDTTIALRFEHPRFGRHAYLLRVR